MGNVASCVGCHYSNCFNSTTLFTGPTSYKFAAEIFKLSSDKSEWLKVHPSVLSVTVSRTFPCADDEGNTIAELSAVNLKQQAIFRLPIRRETDIKRYSERFVYWKDPSADEIFALNVVSRSDIDQFCAVASGSQPPIDMPLPSAAKYRFQAEMAPLMSARHGHIVDHETIKFSETCIVFSPPDLVQVFDREGRLFLTINAFEIVFAIDEPRRCVYASFPSKALAFRFPTSNDLRAFCQRILNESSLTMAGAGASRSLDETLTWLNRSLDSVGILIRYPPGGNSGRRQTDPDPMLTDPRLPGSMPLSLVRQSVETLFTLKYVLVLRIAALKGVFPNASFAEMTYPTELRARVTSPHLPNFVHLYCCLHAQFSIRRSLKDISDNAVLIHLSPSKPTQPATPCCSSEPSTSLQLSSKHERLLKTITELVQTEESFVTDLTKLLTQYCLPAKLDSTECVEKLLKTHEIFLALLQDAGGDLLAASAPGELDPAQIKDSVMRVSALFINKCNKFKIYSEFSAAHLRFQAQQAKDPALVARLNELNASGQQHDSVHSLLIKPIQRVLKYPLFLDQLGESCPKDSMEQRQCSQALSRMQTLATYVNEMQRIHEEYGNDLDHLARLPALAAKGLWISLRDLFMFAHLAWQPAGEKRFTDCVAFVFTSLIVILGPANSSNGALASGKKKSDRHPSMRRPYRLLPISEVEVTESTAPMNISTSSGAPGEQHYFTIIHMPPGKPEMVFHVSCCHPDIKTHFVKSVKKALKTYVKNKPRPISGSSQSDWGYSSGGGH